jgi:two-component system chemotaxis sensor kinase CheA
MENNELEFLKRLKDTFRVEATDHLRSISNGLLEMEKTPSQDRWTELTESVFRESHSLKGAARSVNLKAYSQP